MKAKSSSCCCCTTEKLAIDGGLKACATPVSPRGLFGQREKRAVMALFDKAIATGQAFGYNGVEEEAYCREFAEWLGGGYADGVNSGTTAVYVALRALELRGWQSRDRDAAAGIRPRA